MQNCEVHYRDIQRRIWQRRFLLFVTVFLVSVALTQLSRWLSPENVENPKPILKSESPLLSPNSVEPEDWMTIVQFLDDQRSLAITRRDESALAFIYAVNSPIAIADKKLIQSLIANNASVQKLNFVVQTVEKISHRWSGSEEVVELEVTDKRSSYYLTQNGSRKLIPKRHFNTWLMSLVKREGGWLIGEVQPLLDDS